MKSQRKHFHSTVLSIRFSYCSECMLIQSQWNQISQLSQAIPLQVQPTCLSQSPHGYNDEFGPGFTSISPLRMSIINMIDFLWQPGIMLLGLTGFPKARLWKHKVIDGSQYDKSCIAEVMGRNSVDAWFPSEYIVWKTTLLMVHINNKAMGLEKGRHFSAEARWRRRECERKYGDMTTP